MRGPKIAVAISFSGSRSAGQSTAASMPSAAARAATAFARLPVEEHASVVRPSSSACDDAVLERVRRVRGVELQPELAHPDRVREARYGDERRPADGEPGILRRRDRQQVGVAPDARRPGLDRLARDRALLLGPVVDGVERSEAARADPDRVQRVLGLTDTAPKCGGGHYDQLLSSFARHPTGVGTLLARAGCRGVTGPVPSASLDAEQDAVSVSLPQLYKMKVAEMTVTAEPLLRTRSRRTSRSGRSRPARSAAASARRPRGALRSRRRRRA